MKKNLQKFYSIFRISFQQEFAYKLSFFLWRFRNVMQIFLVFFLWSAIFSNPSTEFFGYDRDKILTYVFGILIIKALVLSARAVDVASEVASGDLNNSLVKPINIFKYWFARDISSKALNIIFAIGETIILFIILRPPLFLQTNPFYLLAFILSIGIALLLFFFILFITSAVPFWMPEAAWGSQFLFIVVVVEFLSGSIFPLDIFPAALQKILYLLPFPYLIFFPLQTYLGSLSILSVLKGLGIGIFWCGALYLSMKKVWDKGLKAYQAYGR